MELNHITIPMDVIKDERRRHNRSIMKRAILQVADTGPLESLVVMLRSVGYECYLPDRHLRDALRAIGCDTVLDIKSLVEDWGYDEPMSIPTAGISMMRSCDLFVDIKGHRNGPKITKEWGNLKDKILWYRINGGQPEHVINASGDHGDEVNPPCPVLTPNQWYKDIYAPPADNGRAYACWPPFYRFDEYLPNHPRNITDPPLCLIHGIEGWGYKALIPSIEKLGVRMYGGRSPHGLIPHTQIPLHLSKALCMVHLKSNDAPGYSLYEALAAGCPVIISRRLIWRCRMQQLFSPGINCLVYDRETHDGLTEQDVLDCTKEIGDHIERLKDPTENTRIGMAGHNRLKEIMWSDTNKEDVSSLRQFMERNFK